MLQRALRTDTTSSASRSAATSRMRIVYATTGFPSAGAALPAEQDEFGAETRTHGEQQSRGSGFRPAALHRVGEDVQDGRRGQVAQTAERGPGELECRFGQVERPAQRIEDLRP